MPHAQICKGFLAKAEDLRSRFDPSRLYLGQKLRKHPAF